MDATALSELTQRLGLPAWRSGQLRDAIWQPFIADWTDVRQLPAATRGALSAGSRFDTAAVVAEHEADGGLTVKLLCQLHDGQTIETVAMESPASGERRRRGTVCVSTQVGCAVGCPFCATGRLGLRRNCEPAEVVDQVRAANRALHRRGFAPISNIVFMGMGEPLHAYDTTVTAIRCLIAGLNLSPRRITVSTSGVIPGIERLSAEGLPLRLAVSLHAATDALRDRLVPLNRTYPLATLMAATAEYAQRSGRRVTLEWCLIGGVNDNEEQAQALRAIASHLGAHINVIPMNRIAGSEWGPPEPEATRRFLAVLADQNVTIRDTRGGESDAACGQLRAEMEDRRFLLPDGTLAAPRRVSPP